MSASHETAHDHHLHATEESKSRTGLSSSFWFFAILAALFIAGLNFVSVMGGDDHGGGHGDGHEGSGHSIIAPTREATSNQTLSGETGLGRAQADTTQHFDSTRHDGRAETGNQ